MSPVEITGSYAMTSNQVTISARYRLVDPTPLTTVQASLLIYEDNIYWCCGAGGNSQWNGVVRRIHDEPITLVAVNDEVLVDATIPMDPSWNPDELHFIAYLQDTGTLEIIQAHRVETLTASAEVLDGAGVTRVDAILPNPARGSTSISFTVSPIDADAPVSMGIYDPAGRRVVDLGSRPMAAGRHVIHWDGRDPSGARIGSGLYFIRLTSLSGIVSSKLIQLD